MVIGIDLDNTIWNLGRTAVDILNYRHRLSVKYEDCDYDLYKTFSKYVSLSKDDVEDAYKEAALYANIYPYATQVINALSEQNMIYFVTSSSLDGLLIKDERLKRIFKWYSTNNLMRVTNKRHIAFDVIIDDLVRHFSNNQKSHILIDQPYNHNTDVNSIDNYRNSGSYVNNVYRGYDWEDVEKILINKCKVSYNIDE